MLNVEYELRPLLEAAENIAAGLQQGGDDHSQWISTRLRNSVVRPLAQALLQSGASAPASEASATTTASVQDQSEQRSHGELGGRLWHLARAATALRVRWANLVEVTEAAAALQDLAIELADGPLADSRLKELEALQAELDPHLQMVPNGPYLLTNTRRLLDWLGHPLPVRPQMALCRCGASRMKPFCDGTHASIGFTDAKDPNRVPDRRDTYVGQQVTILDNRGLCQHSGFCTARLATVFNLREDPFVMASGGRMDEIVRAVRDCPSGALSYSVDGVEARNHVDHHGTREQSVEVTKDGPYRIIGGIPLIDDKGANVARNQGASSEHYALCRCGQSRNKPFCSGMHRSVEFRDPVPDSDREPTIFEWAGGLPALTRMTRLFYEKYVPEDPLLAPLFATMSADHPQRVAKWLAEVFSGPKSYSSEYGGYPRMVSQHLGKRLTEEQRGRWVALLLRSAQEAGLPNDAEFRSAFQGYIEWGSRLAVENSQTGARPPEHMPMPHWDWHTAAGAPGSRISALAPQKDEGDQPIVHPAAGELVRFEEHVKPMFRQRDRQSMQFAFDLWSYDDVSAQASAILERLRSGTMPCDGAWPDIQIDAFQRWIDAGKPP